MRGVSVLEDPYEGLGPPPDSWKGTDLARGAAAVVTITGGVVASRIAAPELAREITLLGFAFAAAFFIGPVRSFIRWIRLSARRARRRRAEVHAEARSFEAALPIARKLVDLVRTELGGQSNGAAQMANRLVAPLRLPPEELARASRHRDMSSQACQTLQVLPQEIETRDHLDWCLRLVNVVLQLSLPELQQLGSCKYYQRAQRDVHEFCMFANAFLQKYDELVDQLEEIRPTLALSRWHKSYFLTPPGAWIPDV